ncbi:MAG: DUF4367 domain-containing protein [Firmicutes bacterium]|nr:DUF4367 domain-containing protein [Bacillota bacterium]
MKKDFITMNPIILDVLREDMERRIKQIPNDSFPFSSAFEDKWNRLIQVQSKPYYRFVNTNMKKALLGLAAAIILLITMVFSVSALREPVVRFFIEVYEKFSAVFFNSGEDEQMPPVTLEAIYEPAWLPEGYVLDDEAVALSDTVRISYYFKDDDMLVFQQHTIASGMILDTEGTETQPAIVHNQEAVLCRNKGMWTLLWNDGQYGFSLSGLLNKDDLLRMAESMRNR